MSETQKTSPEQDLLDTQQDDLSSSVAVESEQLDSELPTPHSAFELRLPNYEGPLDVLLRLIEEQELEITAVSLATVADQFISYLSNMPNRDPQTIANFLSVAAKLILIKSRALLPTATVPQEEQEETDDLVSQLRAYQLFKRAARILKEREHSNLRAFSVQPPHIPRPQSKTLPLDNVTLEMLARAMQRVVDRLMPPPPVDDVMSRLSFTVNDCMDRIQTSVKRGKVTFTELLDGVNTRVEVVITLLALLELLKRYTVRAYQDTAFGEIIIEPFPEDERPEMETPDAGEIEFVT
jgi:segregation and condensation protein A